MPTKHSWPTPSPPGCLPRARFGTADRIGRPLARPQVTKVDMRHKLCTFIIKNPPAIKDKSSKCVERRRISCTSCAEPIP